MLQAFLTHCSRDQGIPSSTETTLLPIGGLRSGAPANRLSGLKAFQEVSYNGGGLVTWSHFVSLVMNGTHLQGVSTGLGL